VALDKLGLTVVDGDEIAVTEANILSMRAPAGVSEMAGSPQRRFVKTPMPP